MTIVWLETTYLQIFHIDAIWYVGRKTIRYSDACNVWQNNFFSFLSKANNDLGRNVFPLLSRVACRSCLIFISWRSRRAANPSFILSGTLSIQFKGDSNTFFQCASHLNCFELGDYSNTQAKKMDFFLQYSVSSDALFLVFPVHGSFHIRLANPSLVPKSLH